ncbi:hypothetical protein HMPREF1705_04654 [Acetomicrobium hydrogeniformans ATCC BAA-1850]|uniref:Uncharacterized protein n=1 Tax=Acetomicrobium hydrogeniformans ATCC BAA-1850 TaxID=592015 RepID=A0A0T5XAF9_9BACT|nr:hypothetical protein HMPREF1705_04654 [Acetomicrobium hydrogeniformans ATCC BAA-1850]
MCFNFIKVFTTLHGNIIILIIPCQSSKMPSAPVLFEAEMAFWVPRFKN